MIAAACSAFLLLGLIFGAMAWKERDAIRAWIADILYEVSP